MSDEKRDPREVNGSLHSVQINKIYEDQWDNPPQSDIINFGMENNFNILPPCQLQSWITLGQLCPLSVFQDSNQEHEKAHSVQQALKQVVNFETTVAPKIFKLLLENGVCQSKVKSLQFIHTICNGRIGYRTQSEKIQRYMKGDIVMRGEAFSIWKEIALNITLDNDTKLVLDSSSFRHLAPDLRTNHIVKNINFELEQHLYLIKNNDFLDFLKNNIRI